MRREYEYALSHGAQVIPILLDGSFEHGPDFLRDLQGIDFRGVTQHADQSLERGPQPPYSTEELLPQPGGGGGGDRRRSKALNQIADLLELQLKSRR